MHPTITGSDYDQLIREVESHRVIKARTFTRHEISSDGRIGSSTSAMTKATPPSVDLRSNQTGIKNQQDRCTCWAFAAVAALEAYYKRHHQLSLSLSEHYLAHVAGYAKVSQNPGDVHETQSSQWKVCGGSQIIEYMTKIPLPLEADCPYKTNAQLKLIRDVPNNESSLQTDLDALEFSDANVPRKAYLNAKFRVLRWESIYADKDNLLELLFHTLEMNFEICAVFTLFWKERDGIYDYDPTPTENGHVMLIVGYDKRQGIFLLKNSWGERDFIRVTFLFVKMCYLGGHIILEATSPDRNDFKRQRWLGIWNWNFDGWAGKAHIRRYYQEGRAGRFKMGTVYLNNGEFRDIIGDFRDDDRVSTFLGNPNVHVTPDTTDLQDYTLNMFTWEPMHAGGFGYWRGMRFGGFISKSPIVNVYGNNFNVQKWVGRWRMNNDGWHGILTIRNHDGRSFSAFYEPINSNRRVLNVWGNPGEKPWHIELYIKNTSDTTKFYLYYHTWTENLFSGYTVWEGMEFGLFGVKET